MSEHGWCSASGLERVMNCPASAVLPASHDTSVHAKNGQEVHKALEAASDEPAPEFIKLPDGSVVATVELRLPPHSRAELAFGHDVVSGKVECYGRLSEDRGYPKTSYSTVVGTADVIAVGESNGKRCVFVVDFKSGSSEHRSDSWQLRVLAFMAARFHGAEIAKSRITYCVGGAVSHVPAKEWSAEELAETEVLLRKGYDAVQRKAWKKDKLGLGDVRRGGHCHWCPAMVSCPFYQQLFKGNTEILNSRDLAEAYWHKEALRSALGKMEDALKIAASNSPIALGDNKFYGKKGGKFIRYTGETRDGISGKEEGT